MRHQADLILIRHGKAERTSVTGLDADRPLSATGVDDIRRLSMILGSAMLSDSVVMTSPFLRTQQTAAILAASVDRAVVVEDRLAADRSTDDMLELIRDQRSSPLLVIGHMPTIAVVTAQLLQLPSVTLDVPPGTAIGMRWVSRPRMLVDLLWMIPPYLVSSH